MLPDWVNSAGKSVLNWWNEEEKPEAKSAAPQPTAAEVCEEEKPKGPTPFPVANPIVYHFHPIAFVRQMRKVFQGIIRKYKWAHSAFGNLIAEKESANNYNICNQTKGGLKVIRNLKVVETTIKKIQGMQKSREIFAVGRYQLIPITLNAAIKALKIDVNQKLDEEMQDRIFDEYLLRIKRPKIINFLEGNGSVEEAMYEAAKKWASIGVEKGKKISKDRIAKGGESYYAGDGFNKPHITPEEIKKALINSRNGK